MPRNHNIFIEGVENGDLVLSDNGHTDVDTEDTVTWIVRDNSGVEAITSIAPDRGSENVFDPDPAPVGGSRKTWRGTVSRNKKGRREIYAIEYTIQNGNTSQFDPIIQVNP
ncbi:MAG TPA: hypothetical protein VGE66_01725 [Chitinophagaceae bacterium]